MPGMPGPAAKQMLCDIGTTQHRCRRGSQRNGTRPSAAARSGSRRVLASVAHARRTSSRKTASAPTPRHTHAQSHTRPQRQPSSARPDGMLVQPPTAPTGRRPSGRPGRTGRPSAPVFLHAAAPPTDLGPRCPPSLRQSIPTRRLEVPHAAAQLGLARGAISLIVEASSAAPENPPWMTHQRDRNLTPAARPTRSSPARPARRALSSENARTPRGKSSRNGPAASSNTRTRNRRVRAARRRHARSRACARPCQRGVAGDLGRH